MERLGMEDAPQFRDFRRKAITDVIQERGIAEASTFACHTNEKQTWDYLSAQKDFIVKRVKASA